MQIQRLEREAKGKGEEQQFPPKFPQTPAPPSTPTHSRCCKDNAFQIPFISRAKPGLALQRDPLADVTQMNEPQVILLQL